MKKCRQQLDRKRAQRRRKLQQHRTLWGRWVQSMPPELQEMSPAKRAFYLERMRRQGKRRHCRALMEV